MYLRYTTRKKDGKTHRCWRLVQRVRVAMPTTPALPAPRDTTASSSMPWATSLSTRRWIGVPWRVPCRSLRP